MIQKAEFDFPEEFWDEISPEAKDLVSNLLVVDKHKRLNAEQILAHPWMAQAESLNQKELKKTKENIKEYNIKRKFKKAGIAVIAGNRIRSLIN